MVVLDKPAASAFMALLLIADLSHGLDHDLDQGMPQGGGKKEATLVSGGGADGGGKKSKNARKKERKKRAAGAGSAGAQSAGGDVDNAGGGDCNGGDKDDDEAKEEKEVAVFGPELLSASDCGARNASHPPAPARHPWALVSHNAFHGGAWRCPYSVRSAAPAAWALGLFAPFRATAAALDDGQ